MDEIINQLLLAVRSDYTSTNSISTEVMKMLWTIFETPLVGALDIIDRKGVTRATCPSKRIIYKITGSSDSQQYFCLSSGVYCTCPAFEYIILKKEEHIMCKHVLAARLAESMSQCREVQWTDQQMISTLDSL